MFGSITKTTCIKQHTILSLSDQLLVLNERIYNSQKENKCYNIITKYYTNKFTIDILLFYVSTKKEYSVKLSNK